MKTNARMALLVLSVVILPMSAQAQLFRRPRANPQQQPPINAPSSPAQGDSRAGSNPVPGGAAAPVDKNVVTASEALPDMTPLDQLPPATVTLPSEPVDPFLITTLNGPFMVMAKTFRGDEAVKYAQLLAMELRHDYHLAAYVYYPKIQPRHSNIRNVPPTAPPQQLTGGLKGPEKYRLYDEAAVLVGDMKTTQTQQKLLKYIHTLHPKCLDGMPSPFPTRQGAGLKHALATTNPLVPAQKLFPKNADPMVLRMNSGPNSVYKCPGHYTLQVGYFTGRTTFDPNDPKFLRPENLQTSPLRVAHEDAEKLAVELAKTDEITKAGYKVYTYHDRYKSVVTVGAFQTPNDPAAQKLRGTIVRVARQKLSEGKLDTAFGPQPDLMEVPRP